MINPYIMGMFLSVTVASFSQVLLKKSAMKTYDSSIREYLNVWVIGGYFLLFCSMLISLWAYGGVDYKNGPVIESLGNVLVFSCSYQIIQMSSFSSCLMCPRDTLQFLFAYIICFNSFSIANCINEYNKKHKLTVRNKKP